MSELEQAAENLLAAKTKFAATAKAFGQAKADVAAAQAAFDEAVKNATNPQPEPVEPPAE